ncbi:MAG: hypothetical protein O2984_03500 [Bacteroidetes bacterium]|nr:hypothetical protein [Bacteroidota bacterium]
MKKSETLIASIVETPDMPTSRNRTDPDTNIDSIALDGCLI